MFITVSNLFPRPDQPTRGMFNFRLFRSLGTLIGSPDGGLLNICLVPEWRFWRWPEIRRWKAPDQTAVHGPPTSDFRAKTLVPYDLNQSNCGKDLEQKRILEQKVAKAAKEGHVYASGENARVSNQNKSCASGVFRRWRLRVLCELLFKTLHLGSGYAGLGSPERLSRSR